MRRAEEALHDRRAPPRTSRSRRWRGSAARGGRWRIPSHRPGSPRRSPPAASAPRRRCRDRPAAGRAPRAPRIGKSRRTASTSYIMTSPGGDDAEDGDEQRQCRAQHDRRQHHGTPSTIDRRCGTRAARRRSWRRPRAARTAWRSRGSPPAAARPPARRAAPPGSAAIIAFSQTTSTSAPQSPPVPPKSAPEAHGEHHDQRHDRRAAPRRPSSGSLEHRRRHGSIAPAAELQRGVAEQHADAGRPAPPLSTAAPSGTPSSQHAPRRGARPHQAVDDQLAPHSASGPPRVPRRRHALSRPPSDAGQRSRAGEPDEPTPSRRPPGRSRRSPRPRRGSRRSSQIQNASAA